jgi:hypothetical protein
MHWLWGILLGCVLTAGLPILAGALSMQFADKQDSMLVAIALIVFCLLGVIIFKPIGVARQMRVIRGRVKEDEE